MIEQKAKFYKDCTITIEDSKYKKNQKISYSHNETKIENKNRKQK